MDTGIKILFLSFLALGPVLLLLGLFLLSTVRWHWYWAFAPAFCWIAAVLLLAVLIVVVLSNMDFG